MLVECLTRRQWVRVRNSASKRRAGKMVVSEVDDFFHFDLTQQFWLCHEMYVTLMGLDFRCWG